MHTVNNKKNKMLSCQVTAGELIDTELLQTWLRYRICLQFWCVVAVVFFVLGVEFQGKVLHILVMLQHDIRELKQQLSHAAVMLQELQCDKPAEYDLQLPVGVHLPLNSAGDVDAIEAALEDDKFRKQLVLVFEFYSDKQ